MVSANKKIKKLSRVRWEDLVETVICKVAFCHFCCLFHSIFVFVLFCGLESVALNGLSCMPLL